MPETTIPIDRDQRGGLYELIRNHLCPAESAGRAHNRLCPK